MLRQILFVTLILILGVTSSCDSDNSGSGSTKIKVSKSTRVPTLHYSVDKKMPHSTNSFTEGLLFHNGQLFESTGSPENLPSTISVYGTVRQEDGEIDVHNQLDRAYFGEGISILNGKVYQLTYQSKTGFVYDLETKKFLRKFTIPTREGWGMTTDGENLLMTDGSSNIHFLNPETLEKTGTLKVFENGRPVNYLNEIEYVDGYIYANIYTTDWIVKIDENSGKVVARLDLTNLKLEEDKLGSQALEANGIAYNPETKKFFVTGKMWKNIYVISVFE